MSKRKRTLSIVVAAFGVAGSLSIAPHPAAAAVGSGIVIKQPPSTGLAYVPPAQGGTGVVSWPPGVAHPAAPGNAPNACVSFYHPTPAYYANDGRSNYYACVAYDGTYIYATSQVDRYQGPLSQTVDSYSSVVKNGTPVSSPQECVGNPTPSLNNPNVYVYFCTKVWPKSVGNWFGHANSQAGTGFKAGNSGVITLTP